MNAKEAAAIADKKNEDEVLQVILKDIRAAASAGEYEVKTSGLRPSEDTYIMRQLIGKGYEAEYITDVGPLSISYLKIRWRYAGLPE